MAESSIQTEIQEYSVTREELNYLRLANLILRIAPPAVRVTFDKEFDPSILQTTLNKARFGDLESLRRKRNINKIQWELMFPVSGTASSKNFDLTLMICLIRNLASLSVVDRLPHQTDVSEEADLSRLKYYRNKMVHTDDGVLTNDEFNEYWNDISQATVRLGGHSFKQKCDDLKMCKLDSNNKEILTEIRNMDRSHDPIPKGLKRIHMELIEEWTNEKVEVTRAIQHLFEMIKQKNQVLAVGSSGCGKSTSIKCVALMLHHQHGFDIIPIHSPDHILLYFNPERKQVFVFDDMCGKSTIDINLLNTWRRMTDEISVCLRFNTVKILSSCTTHIYQGRLFRENSIYLSTTICHLTSDFSCTISIVVLRAVVIGTYKEAVKIICNSLFENNCPVQTSFIDSLDRLKSYLEALMGYTL